MEVVYLPAKIFLVCCIYRCAMFRQNGKAVAITGRRMDEKREEKETR
jgi:hypothetical protein